MRLFLDTSVLLAACGSPSGGSREIFRRASLNDWTLIATPYVIEEVVRHLGDVSPDAATQWAQLNSMLTIVFDVLTMDRPVVFGPAKDRPILFGAIAWADVLLTLDRRDFGGMLGQTFYGLPILKPGVFLETQRAMNHLR